MIVGEMTNLIQVVCRLRISRIYCVGARVLLLLSCCCHSLLWAASTECNNSVLSQSVLEEHPRIGLVLGGGGARGAAHIGVIQMLEQLRVPVDYVTGTSMGALVGALYATGMSGDELENTLTSLNWNEVFDGEPKRRDSPFRRRRDDDLGMFGPKFGIGKGSSLFPNGASSGQNIATLFQNLAAQRVQTRNFDQLPIPFRAVAADIATGEQVVLDKGDLALAMRSSMSIPGIFSPIELDGHLLVDGGVVNNIPIDVARQIGADIIIAVDVGSPLTARENLTNLFSITEQLSGFLVRNNSEAQLASLTSRDIVIIPELGTEIGSISFDQVAEAIPIGYRAASHAGVRDKLAALGLSKQAYQAYKSRIKNCNTELPEVEFVRIDNKSRFATEVIESHLPELVGRPLDLIQIERAVEQVYAMGFLEMVHYEIVRENGRAGLVLHVEQDTRGTQFIETGMDLAFDGSESSANVRVSFLKTDVDDLGSEFRGLLQLGEEPGFLLELYKPVDTAQRWILLPQIWGERRDVNVFDEEGNRLSQIQADQLGVSFSVGHEIGTSAAVFTGLSWTSSSTSGFVGDPGFIGTDFDVAEYLFSAQYDSSDDRYFPSKGTVINLNYTKADESLGAETEFEQATLDITRAWTRSRNTLIASLRYNTTLDDNAPAERLFRGGGFNNLSGLEDNQISGQHFGNLLISYRYEFGRTGILPAYIGATLEYGNAAENREDIFDEGLLNGNVYFGYRSPIGPLYWGYGRSENGQDRAFLRIGTVFGRSGVSRSQSR